MREKVDCDYYDWLDGQPHAVNLYHGEYMAQYGWSEFTNSGIENGIRMGKQPDVQRFCNTAYDIMSSNIVFCL